MSLKGSEKIGIRIEGYRIGEDGDWQPNAF
jgi:hypothetical protein